MKRLFTLLLATALLVSIVVGCNTSTPSSSAPAAPQPAASAPPSQASSEAPAPSWPERAIRMVIPYGAGGGTDLVARQLAEGLSAKLGVQIACENLTGGLGMTAAASVMGSTPDGYTVLFGTVELVSLPATGQTDDSVSAFTLAPVSLINADPACILVPADSPYKTFEEFVKAGIDNPGQISIAQFGGAGAYSVPIYQLQKLTGAEFAPVVYADGAAAAILGVLAGEVDAITSSVAETNAQIQAGTMRPLAVSTSQRLESHPDIPTFKECGYDVDMGTWRAVFVPKDTPDDAIEILEKACAEVVESEEFKSFMNNAGFNISYKDSSDFIQMIDSQYEIYEGLASVIFS